MSKMSHVLDKMFAAIAYAEVGEFETARRIMAEQTPRRPRTGRSKPARAAKPALQRR